MQGPFYFRLILNNSLLMKALILNSGLGKRMWEITKVHSKCMTEINSNISDTIISRQLNLLLKNWIRDIIITTWFAANLLEEYCNTLELPLNIKFIQNPIYTETNYIYSIFCAKEELEDDIILMHGDLVFEKDVLNKVINSSDSCMVINTTVPLPKKDFKAVIDNWLIKKVGIEFFDNAVTAMPLYKLNKNDWMTWLNNIINFCEQWNTNVYAENAFNEISDSCKIRPLDIKDEFCAEIDNEEDLKLVKNKLLSLKQYDD